MPIPALVSIHGDGKDAFAAGRPTATSEFEKSERQPRAWTRVATPLPVTPRTTDFDFEKLIKLITQTIEPDSWSEVGGRGTIRPNETTLSLVIRQTEHVHDQISDLLDQLRRL